MIDEDILIKTDRHLEIVTSDTTGMKETAFGSLDTCHKVYNILKRHYTHVCFNKIQSEHDLQLIVNRDPDMVVLCVKYIFDEDHKTKIWLSDFFSQFNIAHTGSDKATLEFDSNKSKAKNYLSDKGIATAKFFLTHPGLYEEEKDLPIPLPVFIKPLDAANSNGVDKNSLVHDFYSYETKVDEIYKTYGMSVLVEEFLSGREFTVGVLNDPLHKAPLILPIEIVVPKNENGDRILGFQEKRNNEEQLLPVNEPAFTAVSELARQAFSVLQVQDFGRIDIKMDAYGTPYFMEANLVPGMTPEKSYFPLACYINRKMSYEDVVLKVVECALNRSELPITSPVKFTLPHKEVTSTPKIRNAS